jgi:hypothetical protein
MWSRVRSGLADIPGEVENHRQLSASTRARGRTRQAVELGPGSDCTHISDPDVPTELGRNAIRPRPPGRPASMMDVQGFCLGVVLHRSSPEFAT